jgi:hypothetical protein
MSDKYLFSFEEFKKEHPEMDSEWESIVRPIIETQEEQMFSFIMSYIFM